MDLNRDRAHEDTFVCEDQITKNLELLHAAAKGSNYMIEKLLKTGAHVNYMDTTRRTPLMYAAGNGHSDCVNTLICKGANVNKKDKSGLTALGFAAILGNTACVRKLIESGADVNIRNKQGSTALLIACYSGNLDCIATLLLSGSDVNQSNCFHWTPLMATVVSGYKQCAEFLLQAGASVNQNECGALTAAIYANNVNFVKLLLRYNSLINVVHNLSTLISDINTFKPVSPELYVTLKAAGQVMGYKLDPTAPEFRSDLSLQNLCRDSIRHHLLDLDPHSHLFRRVPQLPLPDPLKTYMLYYVTLDDESSSDKSKESNNYSNNNNKDGGDDDYIH